MINDALGSSNLKANETFNDGVVIMWEMRS